MIYVLSATQVLHKPRAAIYEVLNDQVWQREVVLINPDCEVAGLARSWCYINDVECEEPIVRGYIHPTRVHQIRKVIVFQDLNLDVALWLPALVKECKEARILLQTIQL